MPVNSRAPTCVRLPVTLAVSSNKSAPFFAASWFMSWLLMLAGSITCKQHAHTSECGYMPQLAGHSCVVSNLSTAHLVPQPADATCSSICIHILQSEARIPMLQAPQATFGNLLHVACLTMSTGCRVACSRIPRLASISASSWACDCGVKGTTHACGVAFRGKVFNRCMRQSLPAASSALQPPSPVACSPHAGPAHREPRMQWHTFCLAVVSICEPQGTYTV